jgi:hypothetical protein
MGLMEDCPNPLTGDRNEEADAEFRLPTVGVRYDWDGTLVEVVDYRCKYDNWHSSIWTPFWYSVTAIRLSGPDKGTTIGFELMGFYIWSAREQREELRVTSGPQLRPVRTGDTAGSRER